MSKHLANAALLVSAEPSVLRRASPQPGAHQPLAGRRAWCAGLAHGLLRGLATAGLGSFGRVAPWGLGLGAGAAWAGDAQAAVSGRGLPVPLAQDADEDLDPAGWLVSEKFDGVRALWDGQQLRFRSGLPVAAPRWFTQALPPEPLDGELWLGHGQFEALSGLVRRQVPDEVGWRALRYQVFELPQGPARFDQRCRALAQLVHHHGFAALQAVPQQPLADNAALRQRLAQVLQAGGEGLMLCRADASYGAGRVPWLRKLKPQQDAEAVVLAHVPGRGKHAGRLGALQVREVNGPVFLIGTGFSDAQRQAPPAPGERITFRYRGRTEAGLPRFASFLRPRPDGL